MRCTNYDFNVSKLSKNNKKNSVTNRGGSPQTLSVAFARVEQSSNACYYESADKRAPRRSENPETLRQKELGVRVSHAEH